jgi:hypothetical protein
MATFHHRIKSGKKGTAANHAAYISRQGKHSDREDLVESGFGNMPSWAEENPVKFWKLADKHERANSAVYREHEIALPSELTPEQRRELVDGLIRELVGEKAFQYAVHESKSSLEGATNTHVHLMKSDRIQDGINRPPAIWFRRYNRKDPESGGCKKATGGKNRLVLRDELIETRRKCAELQNTVLARYGHDARVDHRTLRQQGINRNPERHLGQARIRNMSDMDKKEHVAARHDQLSRNGM